MQIHSSQKYAVLLMEWSSLRGSLCQCTGIRSKIVTHLFTMTPPTSTPSSHLLTHYITKFQQQSQYLHHDAMPHLLLLWRYYCDMREGLLVSSGSNEGMHSRGDAGSLSAENHVSSLLLPPATIPSSNQNATGATSSGTDPHSTKQLNHQLHEINRILILLKYMIEKTIRTNAEEIKKTTTSSSNNNNSSSSQSTDLPQADNTFTDSFTKKTPLDRLVGKLKKERRLVDDEETRWKNLAVAMGVMVPPPKPRSTTDGTAAADSTTDATKASGLELITEKYQRHLEPHFEYQIEKSWKELDHLLKRYLLNGNSSAFLTRFPLEQFLKDHPHFEKQWSEVIRLRLYIEDLFWKLEAHPVLEDLYHEWLNCIRIRPSLMQRFIPKPCRRIHVICENLRLSGMVYLNRQVEKYLQERSAANLTVKDGSQSLEQLYKATKESIFGIADFLHISLGEWNSSEDRSSVWMYMRSFPEILYCSWMLIHREKPFTNSKSEGSFTTSSTKWSSLVNLICFLLHVPSSNQLQENPGNFAPPRTLIEDMTKHILPLLQSTSSLDMSMFDRLGGTLHIRFSIYLFHCVLIKPSEAELKKLLDHCLSMNSSSVDHQIAIAKIACAQFKEFRRCAVEHPVRIMELGVQHLLKQIKNTCKANERDAGVICDRLGSLSIGEEIMFSPDIHAS